MDVNDNANVFNNNNNADVESHDERIKKFIKLNSKSSKSDISSRELQNLNAPGDETSRFLEDFDPSQRRGAKTNKDSHCEEDYIRMTPTHQTEGQEQVKPILFDSQGVLLHNQLDLCDCLREECPGCHFRCPKCQSPKCGHVCRNNRRWEYNSVEVEGDPSAFRDNKFKSKPDDNPY